jgi:hypothetical protein
MGDKALKAEEAVVCPVPPALIGRGELEVGMERRA